MSDLGGEELGLRDFDSETGPPDAIISTIGRVFHQMMLATQRLDVGLVVLKAEGRNARMGLQKMRFA